MDSATLIKKLVRSGKYAELWSQKTNNHQNQNQNQKQKNNNVKDDKNKGQKQVQALKIPAFSSEEDGEYYEDFEDDEDDEDEEMKFIREKANHLQMLRQQQATDANNVKKSIGAKMNNGGNKKGDANQNMGMKGSGVGVDQKTMAALKLNNGHLSSVESFNLGESKRSSDIGAIMNLAGFNGNSNGVGSATVLGGNSNSNGLGGFSIQSNNNNNNNMIQGSSASIPNGGYFTGQYPSSMLMNMNGFNNHPSPLMMNMNMQARHGMQQQQPQMMYQRSPFIPSNTGYYYNSNYYNSNYSPGNYTYALPSYPTDDHSVAAHMFSDDNTSSSCSIM